MYIVGDILATLAMNPLLQASWKLWAAVVEGLCGEQSSVQCSGHIVRAWGSGRT